MMLLQWLRKIKIKLAVYLYKKYKRDIHNILIHKASDGFEDIYNELMTTRGAYKGNDEFIYNGYTKSEIWFNNPPKIRAESIPYLIELGMGEETGVYR